MQDGDTLVRLRYKLLPDHLVGEILSKRWIDNAIPFLALLVTIAVFGSIQPDFFSLSSLSDLGRQVAEFGLVVLALAIVLLSGGIDLSVGSVFALAVLLSLLCFNVWGWPVPAILVVVLLMGAACGLLNGVLVGYLRLRAGNYYKQQPFPILGKVVAAAKPAESSNAAGIRPNSSQLRALIC